MTNYSYLRLVSLLHWERSCFSVFLFCFWCSWAPSQGTSKDDLIKRWDVVHKKHPNRGPRLFQVAQSSVQDCGDGIVGRLFVLVANWWGSKAGGRRAIIWCAISLSKHFATTEIKAIHLPSLKLFIVKVLGTGIMVVRAVMIVLDQWNPVTLLCHFVDSISAEVCTFCMQMQIWDWEKKFFCESITHMTTKR